MILYETSFHYYLVGYDSEEISFRVLKIDRRVVAPKSLDEILHEDPCVYSKEDLAQMLEMVNEGNTIFCTTIHCSMYSYQYSSHYLFKASSASDT